MKTAGLIGGLGPESTIDYYRMIIDRYRERNPDGSYPSMIINSVDLNQLRAMFERNELSDAAAYLSIEVRKLAAAGADFGLLTANTPHLVFDALERQSPIPLISIVRATCAAAKLADLSKLGLFGTRFTMQARLYPDIFSAAQMTLVVPRPEEQEFIHEKYMSELLNGRFLPETRAGVLEIAARMKNEEGTEAVILAGTELPLLLRGSEDSGIRFLDTTAIHVEAVVDHLLA